MNTDVEVVGECLTEPEPSDRDFIEEYVEYADIFEAPPEAHEAVALTTISAAANGKVWIRNGGQRLPLDKWTLLLSGSGVGRNTLVSLLWPVLKEAGLEGLARNTTWGSKQGFYQDLAENPTGFFVWEEVSAALKALSDSKFGEAKQWLTNCYDNERPPSAIRYRKTGLGQDTPPIEFVMPPRISILATSSRDWFVNCLSQEDSMGGFIRRRAALRILQLLPRTFFTACDSRNGSWHHRPRLDDCGTFVVRVYKPLRSIISWSFARYILRRATSWRFHGCLPR